VSTSVGPTGGTVQASGVTLHVPEGAVSQPVTITVATATDTAAPPAYDAFSPIFQFSPDGLVFQKPITVDITITASVGSAMNIVWSTAEGGYEDLPSTTNGNVMSASVSHFSRGFIGHKKQPSSDGVDAGGGSDAAHGGTDGASDGSSTITDASTCGMGGGSCDAGSQCCSGACNGGTCGFCGTLHMNCALQLPCCPGYSCLNALCVAAGG
jgi:hypothetical protein